MCKNTGLISLKTLTKKYNVNEEEVLNLALSEELYLVIPFYGFLVEEQNSFRVQTDGLFLRSLELQYPLDTWNAILLKEDISRFFSDVPVTIHRVLYPDEKGTFKTFVPILADSSPLSRHEADYPRLARTDLCLIEKQVIKVLGEDLVNHDGDSSPEESPKQKFYIGWKEIIAAWVSHGQKKVSDKQMRNYAKVGLKIEYINNGQKEIPTCTDESIKSFIYQRELEKSKKK